jgi:hypothetical protein
MPELDDETLDRWMTSAAFRDFLECESTRDVGSTAITAVAGCDVAKIDAALSDVYVVWCRTVNVLRNPHPSSAPARWQLYADASAAALAVGALARIGGDQEYELDLAAVRGSLGLHGMEIVNTPAKLAEFMGDPWSRLTHELAEALKPLAAICAVHAGRASRVLDPDGSWWWAWSALYEPAARAAGDTAVAAWHLTRSSNGGQLQPRGS